MRVHPINHVMDASAGGVVVASFFGMLTPATTFVLALLGIIYYAIQISESKRFGQFTGWVSGTWLKITKPSPDN